MEKKLSLKELFQRKIVKFGIKEIIPSTDFEEKFSKINIRLINRMPFTISKKDIPTIAIIAQPVSNRLSMMPESLCRQKMDNILKQNLIFIVLANSSSIPSVFKDLAAKADITIATSKYDEFYLKSLLKSLIREKIQGTIGVHGVVLEIKGKGILITGASGIGKTTAALKIVTKDDYWIADDLVIIKRNKLGELIATGHKKIQNYIHTKDTGIVPVQKLLKPERVKKKTKLSAIIEVERNDMKNTGIMKKEMKILDIKLICFHIITKSNNHIKEHLIKKALEQLTKENQ